MRNKQRRSLIWRASRRHPRTRKSILACCPQNASCFFAFDGGVGGVGGTTIGVTIESEEAFAAVGERWRTASAPASTREAAVALLLLL
mmetsp:Transcript_64571/g.170526  ORF Transcript_64571/g.170526 Transcript_64571/m.170526 type:complete len:88 (+) Transcript_64571:277-540(+)